MSGIWDRRGEPAGIYRVIPVIDPMQARCYKHGLCAGDVRFIFLSQHQRYKFFRRGQIGIPLVRLAVEACSELRSGESRW